MRPLPEADMRILRAWTARVQFGYWMHNGMLSWDSGLGFKRWMKAKTWAYALQGPLAIASSPRFWLDPRQGAWAKHVFDRALWQFAIRCEPLAPRHLPVRAPLRRRARVPGHRQPAHLRGPHGRERRAGDRSAGSARWTPSRAAAVLLLRRRRRAPEREHAPLLRRDRGRQPRRVPVRRDRPRAAVRPAGRAGRRRRRAAAGQLRRRAAPPRPPPRARDAGRAGGRRGGARALAARAA